MEPDFSGWATKAGVKCADGRTITPQAFEQMNNATVPLVWRHDHNSPENVLGHANLEANSEGVRCHGFFNDTPAGRHAKALVEHGDVDSLSIWANGLVERAKIVMHGIIREVSLVLSGANPGAKIDYVRIAHSDDPTDYTESDEEAIIHGGQLDKVDDTTTDDVKHQDGQTLQELFDTLTEEQKNMFYFMLDEAVQGAGMQQSNEDKKSEETLEHREEGSPSVTHTRNIFEKRTPVETAGDEKHVLTHDAVRDITKLALRHGTLKAALEDYCLQHGIENIDVLFPDAKSVDATPQFDKRRTEWVASLMSGVTARPFARIKSLTATLTLEDARARGYVKGNFKKEEWFSVTSRSTTPTTIYKKQKLDRNDIIDITDFDVVRWLKGEIRLMLEEEIGRAVLLGDGREVDDEDKVKDPAGASSGEGIRSVLNDHELYAAKAYVNLDDANSDYYELVEQVLRQRRLWKGTGTPNFYTTEPILTEMLLCKDGLGRRRFSNLQELAAELRVAQVIPVEPMESHATLVGILLNPVDYTTGTDQGGEVSFFDDFDLDYNKFLYLMEARLSGALTVIRSAIVFLKTAGTNVLVHPITAPTFVASTGVITIPTQTGVTYVYVAADGTEGSALSAGAQTAIAAGTSKLVRAKPASGYYFNNNIDDEWTFKRPSA